MLFWLPVQLYFVYRYFFDQKWKIGFKERHWFYRGFVYVMIGSGLINAGSLVVYGLAVLVG